MPGPMGPLLSFLLTTPPTWPSSIASTLAVFLLGARVLGTGLTFPGAAASFLLGTFSWRAFGPRGYALVSAYFVLGTAATKVKLKQKQAQGVAEGRGGRRGPGSVVGSGAAGFACAAMAVWGVEAGLGSRELWELGFVASFCTKLGDTVSSEIGKAYGRTTYLVTNFKTVPRGTEGAVSVEGTLAGLIAAALLAGFAWVTEAVGVAGAVLCVVASQIANFGESFIGATLQGKDGFGWLDNDVVNVINISLGSALAILMQQVLAGRLSD